MVSSSLLILVLSAPILQQGPSPQPSADQIVASAKAAMSKPLKYRAINEGVTATVYQKSLQNGAVGSLSEMTTPIKRITLVNGDKTYELYLEHRVAIDTQVVYQAAKQQSMSALSVLGNKASQTYKLVGTAERDGKECYEIESVLTPEARTALGKAAGDAKTAVPASFRYFIDKKTNFFVEVNVLSASGAVLSKSEFKDITPQSDLSDEFFLLPPGLDIKHPHSVTEYMTMVSELHRPKFAPAPSQPMRAAAPPAAPPEVKKAVVQAAVDQPIEPRPKGIVATLGVAISTVAAFVVLGFVVYRRMLRPRS